MDPQDGVPTARISSSVRSSRHRLERLQSAQKRVQMVARRERRSSIEAPAGTETVGEDEPSGGEIVMRKVLAHGCATIGLFLHCSPVLENWDLHPRYH